MKRIIYLLYLLLISFSGAFGQSAMIHKTYYLHQQACNGLSTVEIDYFLYFKNDSTALYVIYSTDYKFINQTVFKETYEGTYRINGDTLSVQLSTHSTKQIKKDITNRFQEPEKPSIAINKSINYIISGKSINALNYLYPSLLISEYRTYFEISGKFEE